MPMTPTIPASAAQWLISALIDEGVSLAELLAGTGLDNGWCRAPDAILNSSQYEQLVFNALTLSGNPALGLSVPPQINYLSRYGFWGYSVMSCDTLGEALETAVRYLPLTGSLVQLRVQGGDEMSFVEIVPAFDFVRGDIWRFGVEKCLSTLCWSLTSMLDQAVPLQMVELSYAAPSYAALYEDLLGCPVRFGADRNCFALNSVALGWPLVTSQPQLADLCRERCAQAMLKLHGNDPFVASVQEIIWANISRAPSLDEVAAQLNLASRTLRRRLSERGSSFQRILDSVREARARDYLLNTDLSIDQIASLVGFSEPTTFRSTFKRWTGQSAAEIRRTRA